ncbi:MAG TPA: rRNA maturation RNase YbeY [Gemmatimonadaceae bacterium]|nr:rRNA maturation RNase YbeY [Gemmatimonadaceae bacterium]
MRRRERRRPAPSIGVAVNCAGVRVGVSRARLARLAESVVRAEGIRFAEVSVTLVTSGAIARLNRKHLGHRGATDVIAFALPVHGTHRRGAVLGDVYVCPAVARRNAREHRVSFRNELERLIVHGTLHALGWDHPDGDARIASPMWRRQEALLRRWQRRVRAA